MSRNGRMTPRFFHRTARASRTVCEISNARGGGKLLRPRQLGNAALQELAVHGGGNGVVEIHGEVFLGKFDGMEFLKVAAEGVDQALHVLAFLAVHLVADEVAQAFVADGGGRGDRSTEENDA